MIVGRSTELEELDRLLGSAVTGDSGRILLVGDPGMGCTALMAAFAHRARGRGVDVIQSSARSVADPLLADRSPEPMALAVLLDDGEDADDAHVAGMLRLADHLATRPALLVVAVQPPVAVMPALALWPRLVLGPLAAGDAVEILREELGDEAAPDVLHGLAEQLGGNPLALHEVPRLLTAEQRAGRVPLPVHLPVPPALDRAWGRVIDALPPSARAAASDLAIVGPRADLLAAMGQDAGWSHGDLATVVDAGLAIATTDVAPSVVNDIVRDVILQRATATVVQARHTRAAALATALGLPPRVVVHHLGNSVATADERVAEAVEVQAVRAEDLDAMQDASEAWLVAARISTSTVERARRARRGMQLIVINGLDYPKVMDLPDLLADQQLDPECALLVDWLSSVSQLERDPQSALSAQWATIRRATTQCPESVRGLLLDAAANAWTQGDAALGLRAAREYCAVAADATDTVEPPWTADAIMSTALFMVGDIPASRELRRRAVDQAAQSDPTRMPLDRLLNAVFLDDMLLDTSPQSTERLAVAGRRSASIDSTMACIRGIEAWRARARGSWGQAVRLAQQAEALADRSGATGAQRGIAALRAELAAMTGDDQTLARVQERLRQQASAAGDRLRLSSLDHAVGLRALVDGRLEDASPVLSSVAALPFLGRGLRDAVIPARVDLVELRYRQGDGDAAHSQAAEIEPLLLSMDEPRAEALAARVSALTSAEPDAGFRAALAAHQVDPDPFEEARTRLLYAEFLRRDRQRAAARLQLLEALRLFDALGARPWSARTRQELRATGGSVESTAGIETLTPQERAVAESVADGHSNREVAEALFLSPRTVEYHLGNVYRKLGVHGRAGLARRLAGHGD